MRFWLLGLAVVLAAHFVAAAAASLLVAWAHRRACSRLAPLAPGITGILSIALRF